MMTAGTFIFTEQITQIGSYKHTSKRSPYPQSESGTGSEFEHSLCFIQLLKSMEQKNVLENTEQKTSEIILTDETEKHTRA